MRSMGVSTALLPISKNLTPNVTESCLWSKRRGERLNHGVGFISPFDPVDSSKFLSPARDYLPLALPSRIVKQYSAVIAEIRLHNR